VWVYGARSRGGTSPLGAETLANFADTAFIAAHMGSNVLVDQARVRLQQDLSPLHNTHRPRASLAKSLQPLSCFVREANNVLLHAVVLTTGENFME
jgi:hypothetical protein